MNSTDQMNFQKEFKEHVDKKQKELSSLALASIGTHAISHAKTSINLLKRTRQKVWPLSANNSAKLKQLTNNAQVVVSLF